MNHTANLARQTAELHSLIIGSDRIVQHPKGHTAKVLRYRTACGIEIAVEKRAETPLLYFTQALAEQRLVGLDYDRVAAGTEGRNSNLNALDTFRNRPLARLRVTTLDTARKALTACVSK